MSKYSGALARRYGTALFEVLVTSSKDKTDFEKSIEKINTVKKFFTKKIISFLQLPSLTTQEKMEVLGELLAEVFKNNDLPKEIACFLKLLILNHRLYDIQPIFQFFLRKADNYLNLERATLISARPVSDSELKEFEDNLKQSLNKRIVLNSEVDPSLKSGFVVNLGNLNIDASFKARINSLKELFN